jgi:hypothetical protein
MVPCDQGVQRILELQRKCCDPVMTLSYMSNSPPLKTPDSAAAIPTTSGKSYDIDTQGNGAYIFNPIRSLNNMILKAANVFIPRLSGLYVHTSEV